MHGIIVGCCIRKERCPTYAEFSIAGVTDSSQVLARMAKKGTLRVEVYGKNYRVVRITSGISKGLHTLEHPRFNVPYKTFGPTVPA